MQDPVKSSRAVLNASGSNGTILLAEDAGAIRQFVAGVLREQGYTVLAASDGAEALGLAGSYRGAIHVLLTDFDMPKLNGAELAAAMRNLFPSIPVIVMSGGHKRDLPDGSMNTSFLGKPFSALALLEKISTVFGDGDCSGATPPTNGIPRLLATPLR